jgi:hypothetical protein
MYYLFSPCVIKDKRTAPLAPRARLLTASSSSADTLALRVTGYVRDVPWYPYQKAGLRLADAKRYTTRKRL